MKIWCLFEQSGTFKNEFKKLGFEAYDVDILDDFGETDFKVDLFFEINSETCKHYDWHDGTSFFDKISKDDLVFAFFPCTRFTEKHYLNTKCKNSFMKNFDDLRRLEYTQKMINETHRNYILLCQLFEIALKKGFKMVVENPDAVQHFLKDFFPFKPTITIKDRSQYGDYYKKPTNFWFVNFKPSYNFIFKNITTTPKPVTNRKCESKNFTHEVQVEKSLISPTFANRFIREFILEPEQP